MSFCPPPLPPTAPLDRLSSIVIGLSQAIWGRREHGFFTVLVVSTLLHRIGRAVQELKLLAAAFQAGTLRTRRSPAPGLTRRRSATPPVPGLPDPLKLVTVALPRAFGWLSAILGEARLCGFELAEILEDPEMKALLAASPRAVRAIRPLCRMLRVPMPKPPARVPPVSPAPVRPTESRSEQHSGAAPVGSFSEPAASVVAYGGVRGEDDEVFENWQSG